MPENLRRIAPLLGAIREVADADRVSMAQIALAWSLHRPNVVVIPGASSVEQAESNAAAADIELSAEEDRALTEASDAYRPLQGAGALGALVATRAERIGGRVRRTVEGLRS